MNHTLILITIFCAAISAVPLHQDRRTLEGVVHFQSSTTPRFTRCFSGDLQAERDCCSNPEDKTCFNDVFTAAECCSSDQAVSMPVAVADGIGMPPRRVSAHPAHTAEQRQFELMHRRASKLNRVKLLDEWFSIIDFKSSWKFEVVSKELENGAYNLRELRSPQIRHATFLDIGANIGLVSLFLARMHPESLVVALEPVPELYRYFLWNLKLNNLTRNVWPLNVGLGKEGQNIGLIPADASFYWAPNFFFTKGPHISFQDLLFLAESFARVVRGNTCNEAVNAVGSMDPSSSSYTCSKLRDFSNIRMMKIDCEGCEYDAFNSLTARDLASRYIHEMRGEVHDFCYGCSAKQADRVLKYLCTKDGYFNHDMVGCDTWISGHFLIDDNSEKQHFIVKRASREHKAAPETECESPNMTELTQEAYSLLGGIARPDDTATSQFK